MTVWYDETVDVVGLAVQLECEVLRLFLKARTVGDSLVSFSILFQSFRVFGKND